jgi:hypothetical protein
MCRRAAASETRGAIFHFRKTKLQQLARVAPVRWRTDNAKTVEIAALKKIAAWAPRSCGFFLKYLQTARYQTTFIASALAR